MSHLLALARAEDKGVRLRTCQLLQLIINNQVLWPYCAYIGCYQIVAGSNYSHYYQHRGTRASVMRSQLIGSPGC